MSKAAKTVFSKWQKSGLKRRDVYRSTGMGYEANNKQQTMETRRLRTRS